MKKTKIGWKHLIVFIAIILGLMVVIISLIITYYIPKKNWKGAFFRYDEMLISSNESYIGVIDIANEKVSIIDDSGKEVSDVDIKEEYPDQIVLGNRSYFLLYCWENENGDGKIVQYDYQSNKIKECTVPNIATIAYRNNYLFIGDWRNDEEDAYYYFVPYYNEFYANRYISEEQFGNQPEKIPETREGWCLVGSTKMYYHEEGYFSTVPVWDDYPGTSTGDFTREDKVWNYQAQTEQEMKNRDLLVKLIGNIGGAQKPIYQVNEYQSGNDIYGICNIFSKRIPCYPVEPEDVIRSYCYKISQENNEIEIMAQTDSCTAIIATDLIYVYQKDNFIISQNLKTGDEKVIYKFDDYYSLSVCVQGDYLLVCDKIKYTPVKWNV